MRNRANFKMGNLRPGRDGESASRRGGIKRDGMPNEANLARPKMRNPKLEIRNVSSGWKMGVEMQNEANLPPSEVHHEDAEGTGMKVNHLE